MIFKMASVIFLFLGMIESSGAVGNSSLSVELKRKVKVQSSLSYGLGVTSNPAQINSGNRVTKSTYRNVGAYGFVEPKVGLDLRSIR